MKIVTALDKNFEYKKCEELYLKNEKFMNNTCSFKSIVQNSHFYSFYSNKILLGCIYVTCENGKLFINGFSVRKNFKNNKNAINQVIKFYNCPIYAKTKNKTAIFLLKNCGFVLWKEQAEIKYLKKEN